MTTDTKEYIELLEWYIDVQYVFLIVLYRDLNRRMEAPKFMRYITNNGIQEIFEIYKCIKKELKL